ncbi:MAG: hypothetical protein JSU68_15060, partial [Phycisphaerales bacterium]
LGQSETPHLVLMADAFLRGQFFVRAEALEELDRRCREQTLRPRFDEQVRRYRLPLTEEQKAELLTRPRSPVQHDWSPVGERYYGYWAPLPAVLLMPYVAVAGLEASDRWFTAVFGALSVLATYLMLREARRASLLRLSPAACIGLVLLLGLGTVHFCYASVAGVWFTTQIVAVFWLTSSVWLLLRSRGRMGWVAAAGAALGAGVLSRSPVLLTLPFFLAVVWKAGSAGRAARLACLLAPVLAAGCVQLAYNQARFGHVLNSGQGIQIESESANPRFVEEYRRYGHLNVHYLPRNLYYYFLNPSLPVSRRTGVRTFDPEGNSVFLVTPAMILALLSVRRRDWFTAALWLGGGTTLAALLLFRATGYFQFGNRYLLDLMPLLILLVAVGMKGRTGLGTGLLIVLSIGVNAWGAHEFRREIQWRPALAAEPALLLIERGQYGEGIEALRRQLDREPFDLWAAENLAWALATCPEDGLRKGEEAVVLAKWVAGEKGHDEPRSLDTLAAAYAEAGDYQQAVEASRRALRLARERGFADLASGIEQRSAMYEAGVPYREKR